MINFALDDEYSIDSGTIPQDLIPGESCFDELWNLRPDEHSEVQIVGKRVKVPRWDRAYGKDYPFSNQVADAHHTPYAMKRYLAWAQDSIDSRFNGLFVNWHDGSLKHYHGKHRDSTAGLVPKSPILTISLGEERVFRMRQYPEGSPRHDVTLQNGDFIIIPWDTNQHWTHEIPRFARYVGRRISITMRAFT